MKNKHNKGLITNSDMLKKKAENSFRKKIRTTFTDSGFQYIRSDNIHFNVGHRKVELDYIFIYENVILICEDTCGKNDPKKHIRNKNEAAKEINNNKEEFFMRLKENFPDKISLLSQYSIERYLLFYLYFPMFDVGLTDDDEALFDLLTVVDSNNLSYFYRMSQCINYSAKYEIFRFLKIRSEDLGNLTSEGSKTSIKAPIIYPKDTTGLRNNVRIVSFMMSAEKLLKTSYVLRKDNWEESIYLYQRLLEKEKVKSIRTFLANKGEAFFNNIIVALPDNISFEDANGNAIPKGKIQDFQNCKLIIPDEMNSICVIDGQHRIFAHYEAAESDKTEKRISVLRKQLHLLVTGLIFPDEMKEAERIQLQSEIFLDINNNSKKVAANVLTHIEMIKDPFSDIGLARRVIEKLNKKNVFLNRFELSAIDENKIKVASIIKYALKYLVSINPADDRESMFNFWNGNKELFEKKDMGELDNYLEFCAKSINMYFSAIKNAFSQEWNDPKSKILSVVSINGFIIALNRMLPKYGLKDFAFYSDHFHKLSIDFSKENFRYTSSQYRMFSSQLLKEGFEFTDADLISF